MKKIFYLAAVMALTTGLFSACTSEDANSESIADGSLVNVSFKANFDRAPQTRAGVAGESNGTAASTLTVAVYNSKKQEIAAFRQVKENAFNSFLGATVDLQLVKGQTYDIVFWAQNPKATTNAVTFDFATGKVNVDYTKISANDETLDAFIAQVNLKVTGELSQDVMLKRPWAQLNFGSNDVDWGVAVAAGVTVAKSKVTIDNVYTQLDAITGKVVPASATTADVVLAASELPKATLKVDGVTYRNLGLNYLLVGNLGEKSLINADLEVQQADGTVINALTFSNVPVQRNNRTNIVGNLLTSQVSFNITIDPLYEGDLSLRDDRIDDVVPEEIRDDMKDYIPIYDGVNPPKVEGTYFIEPFVAVYCQDQAQGGYAPGSQVSPYYIQFYNQNTTNNTLDYKEQAQGGISSSVGEGAFISGEGDNFTVFFNTIGMSSGIETKTALIISGTKTADGIKDLYYAFVMVDKGPDPDHKLMEEGVFRVFKDEDGLSVPTSWPSESRIKMQEAKYYVSPLIRGLYYRN
jgi:hypothetical protein